MQIFARTSFVVAFFLATTTISACGTIQFPPIHAVSARGGQATHITDLGFISRVETGSIAPGEPPAKPVNWSSERCVLNRVEIVIVSDSSINNKNDHLCVLVARSVDYIKETLGSLVGRNSIKIFLVPEGRLIKFRATSWAWRQDSNVSYMFPWSINDGEYSTTNVVSTVAHESFHLIGALDGREESVWKDEPRAYMMGTCALFSAVGEVRFQDLPALEMEISAGQGSLSAVASSQAGATVSRGIIDRFHGMSKITVGTPQGDDFTRLCSSIVDR